MQHHAVAIHGRGEKRWMDRWFKLNTTENQWRDLKINVCRLSPSNLLYLELFCNEEWANILIFRCEKAFETYNTHFFLLYSSALRCVGLSIKVSIKYNVVYKILINNFVKTSSVP